ncbi:AarF/ABC1/UbiB kinase family protein [Candidatus Micrarchaeota archaeon]|nr:AarF/ABC1/UbiB kinase family protein [Candidatus Micrarchaeota archaeon]
MAYFSLGYKHFKRLRQIYHVLSKYGFIEVVDWLQEGKVKKFVSDLFPQKTKKPLGERIRCALEELGPTFIKFGQILSTRGDLFPPEVIVELEKLQDAVPPFSFDEVKQILQEEFKGKKVFKKIDEKPLAAASIGQVHKAVLLNGDVVAVKIQRPGIKDLVEEDVQILFDIANFLESNFQEVKYYQPVDFVQQFAFTIRKEMDYLHEMRNAQKFARNFEKEETVRIPKTYPDFTTKRVLVLEFLEGKKITDCAKLSIEKRKKIVERGANAVMKQVLQHGFFQADPHAGNLLVLKNDVIGIVDFGMVGYLDESMREQLSDFFVSLITKDTQKLVDYFISNGMTPPDLDEAAFKIDLDELIDQYYGFSLKEMHLAEIVEDVFTVSRKHKIRMQPRLLLLFRLIVTLEGVGRKIYPQFNTIPVAKPYIEKILREKNSPSRLLKKSLNQAHSFSEAVARFPMQVSGLMSRAQKGELEIKVDHHGLDESVFRVDRAINKISLALMTTGLFLGSSILAQLEIPPLVLGLSWLAWVGFLFSGLLGFLLLVSILWSREI